MQKFHRIVQQRLYRLVDLYQCLTAVSWWKKVCKSAGIRRRYQWHLFWLTTVKWFRYYASLSKQVELTCRCWRPRHWRYDQMSRWWAANRSCWSSVWWSRPCVPVKRTTTIHSTIVSTIHSIQASDTSNIRSLRQPSCMKAAKSFPSRVWWWKNKGCGRLGNFSWLLSSSQCYDTDNRVTGRTCSL